MGWTVGQSATWSRAVTDTDVRAFAEVSGDHNPVHLDDEYARGTAFCRRIAHGMLGASFISAAMANTIPGPGAIYVSQTLKFKAPVFPGDSLVITLTVTAVRSPSGALTIETVVRNQEERVVIEGEAVVMAP